MQKTASDTLDLDALRATCRAHDIAFAGLFGSAARGEADAGSDLDPLVRFDRPKSLLDLARAERALRHALGHEVDLVTAGALSPHVRPHVMADLVVLMDARPRAA
jgi:predicted nucleotidyltransferase